MLWIMSGTFNQFNYSHSFSLCCPSACSGDHTETVEIEFDPEKQTYEKLLKMFWANHDPTQCHKRQYMSAIFYHGEEQKAKAEKSKEEHQETVKREIQTKILPAGTFYQAEE